VTLALAVRSLTLPLALAALCVPAQASPDRDAPRAPARIFVERPLDALGLSFLEQLAERRAPSTTPAATRLPDPGGYALPLSALGLLAYVARRRIKALRT
jgi:hypothetical protein